MKMKSLSRVGLGLSVVFTCLLLALLAEIYYLLWWKRRIIKRKIQDGHKYNQPKRQFLHLFCFKKQSKNSINLHSTEIPNPQSQTQQQLNQEFQFQSQNNKDNYFGTILGHPRFLFTIQEETKEDLESEDGKSTKGKRSLSDLLKTHEINQTPPFLTPISSPQFVTPPITPMGSCHSNQSGGYNPFFESSNDAEFSKIVKSSPPPKFKFLRDAEEKLQRRIMMFEQAKSQGNLLNERFNEENGCFNEENGCSNEKNGCFIKIIVAKNEENEELNHHYHSPYCFKGDSSCSSQVPLASSPSNLAPSNRKFKNFLTL